MAEVFYNDVTEDFKKLYETREDYDAIIITGKEPNIKEIYVHSLILRTRSSYFHSAFSSSWAKKTDVDFKNQEKNIILELLVASDELGIQRLINYIQEFLIQNCYKFLQYDPIKIFEIIVCYESFDKLKKVSLETFTKNCQDFLQKDIVKILHLITRHKALDNIKEVLLETICKNPYLLFNSDDFLSLEEDMLISILKCDNLKMKECAIWKRLIEWGIVQNPTLNNKVANFTYKDFNKLEKTLHELIKHIRFHQMDREKFMLEVWPLRHLLPDNLIEDILRSYLVSDAVPLYNKFQ
ncbi:11871_t:CDS:2, partial [Scutellospora calospora]